jgi:hypothetical protein
VAELQRAEQAGLVSAGEDINYPQLAESSSKSRAQVVAELQQFAASHSDFVGA